MNSIRDKLLAPEKVVPNIFCRDVDGYGNYILIKCNILSLYARNCPNDHLYTNRQSCSLSVIKFGPHMNRKTKERILGMYSMVNNQISNIVLIDSQELVI